jgi:hypothetical protein
MVTLRVRSMVWFATGVVLAVLATVLVMQTWRVDAAPGDTDSTFVPVAPCRLFDYRPGEHTGGGKKTPLAAGSPATQQVTGTVGNCVIPTTGVVAVAMNVTVVDGTAQSNLRLDPADVGRPLVSNLNWKAGDSATANKVDVKLSPAAGEVKLANFSGSVNVIGDVVGYYTNSSLRELATGLTEANTKIAASEAKIAVLEASEPFAVSNHNATTVNLLTTPISVLNVPVTAPVDGQVTVNYSTSIFNGTLGATSLCAPFRSTEIPDDISFDHQGIGNWETAALTFGDEGNASGTATFDIAAGTTVTYSLACEELNGDGAVRGKTMTAIFTPAP